MDQEMCSFCLLQGEDNVCYWRSTDRKRICTEPEYNEGHIEWSHNVMKMKSVSVNATNQDEDANGMQQ
jgi:hypothetical protein